MGKFDQFAAAEVRAGKLIPYTFTELKGEPRVLIEHLGDTNATFTAEMLAKADPDEGSRSRRDKPKKMEKSVAEMRAANRKAVADHIIRHVDDVTHADGTKATDADLAEFIAVIPNWVIPPLIKYAANPAHFGDEIVGDPEKLAKK